MARVRPMRVVARFKPIARPEAPSHSIVPEFDWHLALRMMRHSARLACHCPVYALTDVSADLPVPVIRVPTSEDRLMLWTLEAWALYLERSCDVDTIAADVDQLFFGPLSRYFSKGIDLTVLIRPDAKFAVESGGQPLLIGLQWWACKSRKRLAKFYRQALELARALPEDRLAWGADTDPVRLLLEPLEVGVHRRAGLTVQMVRSREVMESFGSGHLSRLESGEVPWPSRPVLDFKWTRKAHMPRVYEAAFSSEAVQQ